jgi:hypothetical protein
MVEQTGIETDAVTASVAEGEIRATLPVLDEAYDLPPDTVLTVSFRQGDDLVLVQPDGSFIVLAAAFSLPGEVVVGPVTLGDLRATAFASRAEWRDEAVAIADDAADGADASAWLGPVGNADTLVGIPISPLLTPVAFAVAAIEPVDPVGADDAGPDADAVDLDDDAVDPVAPDDDPVEPDDDPVEPDEPDDDPIEPDDDPVDDAVDPVEPDDDALPVSAIQITIGPIALAETDGPVALILADAVSVAVADPASGERIETITVALTNLPAGTLASAGVLQTGPDGATTLVFTGSPAEFAALVVTLPADYANDGGAPAIGVSVSATSNFGGADPVAGSVAVTPEADLVIAGAGALELVETDAPVRFRPADAALPEATDADGSESVTAITLTLQGLPPGTVVIVDGAPQAPGPDGGFSFAGSAASFAGIEVVLPADFSTATAGAPITGEVGAVTDEGGAASRSFTVSVAPEVDAAISAPIAFGVEDQDASGGATVALGLAVAATDADGSEDGPAVSIAFTGLPVGTGVTVGALDPATGVWTGAAAEAAALALIFPADFAGVVEAAITATTAEGVVTASQTVTVAPTPDVAVTAADVAAVEDQGAFPLGLAAAATDADGSETITAVTLTFANLPPEGLTLSDGAVMTPAANVWTGDADQLASLGVAALPEHYAGVISVTLGAETNESAGAVVTTAFDIVVRPAAEVALTLTVLGDAVDGETVIVREDGGARPQTDDARAAFVVRVAAQTADADGSEALSEIRIANVVDAWLARLSDGTVDPGVIVAGGDDVAGLAYAPSGPDHGVLTITLVSGVTAWVGDLRLEPTRHADLDIETIAGGDLIATAVSVDAAAGLTDTAEATSAPVDVDLDAVADAALIEVIPFGGPENTSTARVVLPTIDLLDLVDGDGSETYAGVTIDIALTSTTSAVYDASDPADLSLVVFGSAAAAVAIQRLDGNADSQSFLVTPAPGVTTEAFEAAIEGLRVQVPQHFSGRLTVSGLIESGETTTGDGEFTIGAADNSTITSFGPVNVTVRPIAEAELTFSAFVADAGDVAEGSPLAISASAIDGDVAAGARTLTLLEGVASDAAGQGPRNFWLGLDAATPDVDGSESLSTLVIRNVPSAWLAFDAATGAVDPASLRDRADPVGAPPPAAEIAKIASAVYDAATGALTIAFAPGAQSFSASLLLTTSAYEDYDVDRADGDPFGAAGAFFGADLTAVLTTVDGNGLTQASRLATATLDVDVDPVNNPVTTPAPAPGAEGAIDAAGGAYRFSLAPSSPDQDGSETITTVLLRNVPPGVSVHAPVDPKAADPYAELKLALLTEVDPATGLTSWSLGNGEWAFVEIRGVPTHFAGPLDALSDIVVEAVSEEADGAAGVTTDAAFELAIAPTVDGGDASRTLTTVEEQAAHVALDGGLLDNPMNSPLSPEVLVGPVMLSGIAPDSQGRLPQFFIGDPAAPGASALAVSAAGEVVIPSAAAARNLYVLPAADSNETITFKATMTVVEAIDPSQRKTATETVTIVVKGDADAPIAIAQDPQPDPASQASIAAAFEARPGGPTAADAAVAFGYGGLDDAPFALDSRFTVEAYETGDFGGANARVEDVVGLAGLLTETSPGAPFDGSETLYFVISGLPLPVAGQPAPASFLGGFATPGAVIVRPEDLASLQFAPTPVSEITFYTLTLSAIAVENDEDVVTAAGLSAVERLAAVDALTGAAVSSVDFTVVVAPNGGVAANCDQQEAFGAPTLRLVGQGLEDQTDIPLRLQLAPDGVYASFADLLDLPGATEGSVVVSIGNVPEGAVLRSDPPGALLFDPVNGGYVVDVAKLLAPNDVTLSSGAILFTPPPHQSSPAGFPDPAGLNGPYDGLDALEITMVVNTVDCGVVDIVVAPAPVAVAPVADGPAITFGGDGRGGEDGTIALDVAVSTIDPGERLLDVVRVTLSNGAVLADAGGATLTPDQTAGDVATYALSPAQLAGLSVAAPAQYGGPVALSVTATTEDVDGATQETMASRTLFFAPVADAAVFSVDKAALDSNGAPMAQTVDGADVFTGIEDTPFLLGDLLSATSADLDGSEILTLTVSGLTPDFEVSLAPGAPGGGLVNNGGGAYTISSAALPFTQIRATAPHARTSDPLDPASPAAIDLTITANVYEPLNGAAAESVYAAQLRVRPQADAPVATAAIAGGELVEDPDSPPVLSLTATTPDPHETIEGIRIEGAPAGSTLRLDGVDISAEPGGAFVVTALTQTGNGPDGARTFAPDGALTLTPPPDFSGAISLGVTATSLDAATGPLAGFEDRATSQPVTLDIDIAPRPDVVVLSATPVDTAQGDGATAAPLAIVAAVQDGRPTPQETLEAIVVTFDAPLPAGFSPNAGALSDDRTTVTLSRAALGSAQAALDAAAAFALVALGDFVFSGTLTGSVVAASTQGESAPERFALAINDRPDPGAPVEIVASGAAATLTAQALLANAVDPSGDALIALNPTETADGVSIVDNGDGSFGLTVDPGVRGVVPVAFQIADDGAPTAVAAAAAEVAVDGGAIEVATAQIGPDGLRSDATGDAALFDVALGSDGADRVVFDAEDRPYQGIDGFVMSGGDDLVDLRGASAPGRDGGFEVDLGAGDDTVFGSSGADALRGGGGDDVFVLDTLSAIDILADFGDGADAIDLTALVTLAAGETPEDRIDYDAQTGAISVKADGESGFAIVATATDGAGGAPASILAIFAETGGGEQAATIA